MRRLDSAVTVGHQLLTRVTKLCVRECVSKYRVLDAVNAVNRRIDARSRISLSGSGIL